MTKNRLKLDADAEIRLVRAAQDGDEDARRRVVQEFQPLIRAIARSLSPAEGQLEDLVQDGTLGLLRALEKFDPARGVRFSTYATPWIEGEVKQALRGSHLIALPAEKAVLASRAARAAERLESELGREPLLAEIAEAVGAGPEDLNAILSTVRPVILASVEELEPVAGEGEPPPDKGTAYTHDEVTRLIHAFSSYLGTIEGTRESERAGRPTTSRFSGSSGVEARLLDLEDALSRLPEREYRVVEVHGFYGLSVRETAEWLGVHENTVRNRFRSAVRAIAAHLNGEKPLLERTRKPDWRPELQPVDSLRLAVRRFDAGFAQLEKVDGGAAEWLGSLEVGWVLLEGEGWVPLFSRDIRETARRMRWHMRSLSEVVSPEEREPST
jgi:RNA polymerase sigma factor (sigma-70 family)